MDVAIIAALVTAGAAIVGTIVSAYYTHRTQRPSALKNLTETIRELSAELDVEKERTRLMRKQFALTVERLENRIYELDQRERTMQRKYSKALEVIRKLLTQLEREGLKPDARLDTGEL